MKNLIDKRLTKKECKLLSYEIFKFADEIFRNELDNKNKTLALDIQYNSTVLSEHFNFKNISPFSMGILMGIFIGMAMTSIILLTFI